MFYMGYLGGLSEITERSSMKEITNSRWDSVRRSRKICFSKLKRPREGERVVQGHFREKLISIS